MYTPTLGEFSSTIFSCKIIDIDIEMYASYTPFLKAAIYRSPTTHPYLNACTNGLLDDTRPASASLARAKSHNI